MTIVHVISSSFPYYMYRFIDFVSRNVTLNLMIINYHYYYYFNRSQFLTGLTRHFLTPASRCFYYRCTLERAGIHRSCDDLSSPSVGPIREDTWRFVLTLLHCAWISNPILIQFQSQSRTFK